VRLRISKTTLDSPMCATAKGSRGSTASVKNFEPLFFNVVGAPQNKDGATAKTLMAANQDQIG